MPDEHVLLALEAYRGYLEESGVPQPKRPTRPVLDNGKGDLLAQRAIRGVLHCDFTGPEFVQAFSDLVSWIETGVKPAGDNFADPAVVAEPSFGCEFTQGAHFLATPCP